MVLKFPVLVLFSSSSTSSFPSNLLLSLGFIMLVLSNSFVSSTDPHPNRQSNSHQHFRNSQPSNHKLPGQIPDTESSDFQLELRIKALEDQLLEALRRLTLMEECECSRSCRVNGSVYAEGASWNKDCDICSCVSGHVNCRPVECPIAKCRHPEIVAGDCCPVCKKQCLLNSRVLEHKEKVNNHCLTCICLDGSVTCHHMDPQVVCPPLNCPEEEQFSRHGECCRFCPGEDYCGTGHHDCHKNAMCRNLKTNYLCQCNKGFWGDGKSCTDINECRKDRGEDANLCGANTLCVNIPGSYRCECLPGYERIDAYTCRKVTTDYLDPAWTESPESWPDQLTAHHHLNHSDVSSGANGRFSPPLNRHPNHPEYPFRFLTSHPFLLMMISLFLSAFLTALYQAP